MIWTDRERMPLVEAMEGDGAVAARCAGNSGYGRSAEEPPISAALAVIWPRE